MEIKLQVGKETRTITLDQDLEDYLDLEAETLGETPIDLIVLVFAKYLNSLVAKDGGEVVDDENDLDMVDIEDDTPKGYIH